MARAFLVLSLYLQEKRDQIKGVDITPDLAKYCPESLSYVLSLLRPVEDLKTALQGMAGWLRVALPTIPVLFAPGILRQLVVQMLDTGMIQEVVPWSALAVRFARTCGFTGYEALFYGYRAVVLAKRGLIKRAIVCRRRAERMMDEADAHTPAFLLWADGLGALAQGDSEAAQENLAASIDILHRLGFEHHVRLARADMKG